MKILIISGEMSSDMYGAKLAQHLLELDPALELHAIGGPHLKAVSQHFVFETVYSHKVGIAGFMENLLKTSPFWKSLHQHLRSNRPDAALIIDFPHSNFSIAKILQRYNIPIYTYITPHFWMWNNQKQAQKLSAYSKKIIAIFEPEYELYSNINSQKTHYFGHPIAESYPQVKSRSLAEKPRRLTLFPGSRKQEFEMLLEPMLQTAFELSNKGLIDQVFIKVSAPTFLPYVNQQLRQYSLPNLTLWDQSNQSLFEQTDWLICASGSATLEALLCKVPTLILGALPKLTYWAAKHLLRIKLPHVALPNILAKKEIMPELVQHKITVENMVSIFLKYNSKSARETLVLGYNSVIHSLRKTPSPSLEAAKAFYTDLYFDKN